MRILLVNKFHYLKGGSEKYYFELGKLLKKHGHEVAYFSMEDKKNIKTGDKEYFVKLIDLNTGSKLKALDVIYSRENKKEMEEALEDFKPDIVHLNNFQRQLSASIIDPIKKRNIPIIYTAHDLQAICPAITMLDKDKNICEKCMSGKYFNCIKKKCIKNSNLKSILGAIEGKYYRIKKIYAKSIDKIIAPSEFYRTKLIEDGIPKDKVIVLHNFIDTNEYDIPTSDEGYAVYIGRLSKEKGILNLIEAMSIIKEGKLKIAGDGPEKVNIFKFIKKNNLEDRIELLGYLNKEQVKDVVSKCRCVVVPSIWYENCPYSVLETLAIGKPVIGSNIGGITELIENNKTGYIYNYKNINDLSEKLEKIFEEKEVIKKLNKNAKEEAKKIFEKEKYYNEIMKVYNLSKAKHKRKEKNENFNSKDNCN